MDKAMQVEVSTTENILKSFDLPSGRHCEIREGKGKHARIAQEQMGKDTGMYMPCLMAQLVTIDGAHIVPEDLDELPLQDYLALVGEFADQNFTSPQGI